MKERTNDILLIAGKILCIAAQAVMVFGGIVLAVVIPAVLLFSPDLAAEAGMESFPPGFPVAALAGVMAIGLAVVVALFYFFGTLRRIIRTVGEGDPFQPKNAERLRNMGWLMLATQVLVIPAAALGVYLAQFADEMDDAQIDVDGGFDLTGLLLVIILFILARVFRHGAAMREDLEGTV